ncbi:hypothetical protein TRAPUB_7115 [Trametes pubescens]|uniref:Uncharacterized protein n=1 Tax=Trametes pubescens TaxID=154538 RepID=A0A1M2V412_TRAPU|nr:hypothetical protein TRAPUB_7115 [Trametes pubescens]
MGRPLGPGQPLLNFDVFLLICESIRDTQTTLSFSLVSSILRPMAVKQLLSINPVVLKDERTIRAFHRFIFADSRSRIPLLRALNISITKLEEKIRQETVGRILDLLKRATRLECLTLPDPMRTFKCLADSRVLDAIIRISTLREIGLLEPCEEMMTLVNATHSVASLRILRVSLGCLPDVFWSNYGIKLAKLDALLRHLMPTIEVLDFKKTKNLVINSQGMQYPTVRSFMAGFEDGIIRTDILVHTFPASDGTLDVGSVFGALQDNVRRRKQLRASNQERQKQRSWRHMDRVIGDVLALFILGLTCPPQEEPDGGCSACDAPTHLKLHALLPHGDTFFEDLFPLEVIPRLTHLVLLLEYTNPWITDEHCDREAIRTMQWADLIAKIIGTVSALRLSHFRLVVHYRIDKTDPMYGPYSNDFLRSLAELDHAHLAAQLMATAPSLQYVFVSMGGEFETLLRTPSGAWRQKRGRWFAHSAWKTASAGAGAPRRLDSDVMERMLLDEDLILSDDDNFSLGFQRTWNADQTAPWPLPE